MEVSYRIDKEILYLAIEGRLDASNAAEAEEKIAAVKSEHPGKHTVVDADHLEYVSSAGLRVILRLRKEEPKLAMINVAPEVYDVLDMTGFTDLITVEKAYRRLSLEGCEFIAKGANGAVYRYDDETIVKVYFSKDALPEIKQERENARRAFVLGVNTAIPYGIVRVGEGYGTVTELLKAESITQLIRQNPEDMTKALTYYVDMLKTIHQVQVEEGEFPDMKALALNWAEFVASHLPEEQGKKLLRLFEELPKENKLLHGDYNTHNIMVQNGEGVLIDLDTLCMGHRVFELGSIYNALVGFSEQDHPNTERFYGYTYETAGVFWKLFLKAYLNTEDESLCEQVAQKAMVVGYTRLLRRAVRRPEEPGSPAIIESSKKHLAELLSSLDSLDF